MFGLAIYSGHEHFAVVCRSTHRGALSAVRARRRELHEPNRQRWSLEVEKVPAGRAMVGLHALQSAHNETLALALGQVD